MFKKAKPDLLYKNCEQYDIQYQFYFQINKGNASGKILKNWSLYFI
jgi:hypothetical protein